MDKSKQLVFPADKKTMTDSGINVRQYFAAKAMQAYAGGEYTGQSEMTHEMIAEWSVKMADALLEALDEKVL